MLSGTVVAKDDEPGCPSPCREGIAGLEDGPLDEDTFTSPQQVEIDIEGASLFVTDDKTLRRVVYDSITLHGITSSHRVSYNCRSRIGWNVGW